MGRIPVFVIVGILFFNLPKLLAQDESAIRPIIKAEDQKKLDKAADYKSQADKLTGEANDLNMQVFTVQGDQTLDQKAIDKKVKQLEDQALQKQTNASALYEKCNEIKFSLYRKYIDTFWKTHQNQESDYLNAKLLEEQSSDNYFQAISYRIEAKKMDGFARIEKLIEALNLENQAIQKQITALAQYNNITLAETPALETPAAETQNVASEQETQLDAAEQEMQLDASVPDTQSITPVAAVPNQSESPANEQVIEETFKQESGKINALTPSDSGLPNGVTVNQAMIDSYNQYISTGQMSDTALSTGAFAGLNSFDHDRVLQLWYDYIYGNGTLETPETAAVDSAGETEKQVTVVTPERTSQPEKEIGIVTDENVGKLIPADDEVIYRVQVAANRNQLSQRALSRMYYGNKNVEMINENGWYKYSVGDFNSYDEASRFRKSSGISSAFVVAYRKGTRFKATPVNASADSVPGAGEIISSVGAAKLPGGLIFRIQVAASRAPLTVSQLKIIYSGSYPVEMIREDRWYKYQFMGVRNYSDAVEIVKNVNSTGAFIVAYEDGVKINLADAVRKNKNQIKSGERRDDAMDVEYHVQLAASRLALPANEISMLWGNPENIAVVYEEGWYKYHIKAGNSVEEAERVKADCKIPGAFITAYRKATKITYYQALHKKN
ncbi:MAG TPA: SPOR domain-containing protein [Bacteroidales bacterium]|nr:SPOR domain-containing protein [Bacteroidales bacterium]